MQESECKSDVAQLMQQITAEYEAAVRGLHGLAQGTAQHSFITQRMENMATCHEALKGLVGEQEAIKFVAQALEQASDEGK
jgi:hypothetical protein